MKRPDLAAYFGLALSLACTSAFAQQAASPPPDDLGGKVICRSKSLTLCQGDYCFVSFTDPPDDPMYFDFGRQTYVFPGVSSDTKPMKMVDVQRAKQHYEAKFTIELTHGTANVHFIANRKDNGSLDMSAAARSLYPPNGERTDIVAINGMACEKNPN